MGQRGIWADISQTELEKLAALQCTHAEIAAWFGVTERTIERRLRNPKFAAILERGKHKGRISLRRQQMRLVEEGSASMAIFLGNNYLKQTDVFSQNPNGLSICITVPAGFSEPAALERPVVSAGEVIEIAP